MVYGEAGRFAGWPANNGLWQWGNEILVGFARGSYLAKADQHSLDKDKPQDRLQARSLDGGDTWTIETAPPDATAGPYPAAPGDLDFTAPGFALKASDDHFWLSADRGQHWTGPYHLMNFDQSLTSRTDVIVLGRRELLLGLSAKAPGVRARLKDRAFFARTDDGGQTFQFLGWMTGEPLDIRSVMPATVRTASGQLVSALRRRWDETNDDHARQDNFVDVHASADDGRTWTFLSKVAGTANGAHNGNPPALVCLPDGRLCVAYGVRAEPYGMRARLSADEGRTWGPELTLRADALSWDMGYPRMAVRPDGRIVTIYYYTALNHPHQHIAATIWEPPN
jgi:hypothetical protein